MGRGAAVSHVAVGGSHAGPSLRDAELQRIVRLVRDRSGITLHAGKRELVAARLHKRLRATGLSSYSDYLRYVETDHTGGELRELLDAIATNHTNFFREHEHFAFMVDKVLPPLLARGDRINLWSAACSTGEEPTTLAVSLLDAINRPVPLRILASDMSNKALAVATTGVYSMDKVAMIPRPLLARYFERGLGAQDGLARVGPAVRKVIDYRRLNLLEVDWLGETFDAIFCRNVMIYFDAEVQQRVVAMLERHLAPGAYLFVAHAETLNGLNHGLRWVGPAVYQKSFA
jgi:chemotaxis protein methyltransferase CheR